MSNKRANIGIVVLFITVLMAFGLKAIQAGQAGKIESVKASSVQDKSVVRLSSPAGPARAEGSKPEVSANSAFNSAALENIRLRKEMRWDFGGKSQLGWELYVPLISATINAEDTAEENSFAEALARWQKRSGLVSSGILDNGTWFGMIKDFQSRRIKNRTLPTDDQLVTAPISDCFDASRPEELRKVERQTYMAYKRMVAAAASDKSLGLRVTGTGDLAEGEKYLKIISAYRSPEYQAELRKKSPTSGRAGLAVNSPHFTGRALDIYVGGEPVSTKDDNRMIQVQTPVYRWLVKNAARFGFRPYFYEPWHWEYNPQG